MDRIVYEEENYKVLLKDFLEGKDSMDIRSGV